MLRKTMNLLKIRPEDTTKTAIVKATAEGVIEGIMVVGAYSLITSIALMFIKESKE